jgi:hypothetical protein
MKRLLQLVALFTVLSFTAFAQIQVLDDFEGTAGRFNLHTTFSGSTTGILSSIPTVDSSNFYHGASSLRIVLIDNPASTANWGVRFLSGTAAPANNVPLDSAGWVGFWLKTDKDYLKTGIGLDESAPAAAATELSDSLDVIGDGDWHLYQWNMADTNSWYAWVGASNGIINNTPTIDAIWFYASNDDADGDTAVVYLDYVLFNPSGMVPVELASFNAAVSGNEVSLRWITSTETNNAGFEVERKAENGVFEKIAFVEGKGTTTEVNGYTYKDAINQLGKYSYRLKQVDYDGTFEYSNVVEVEIFAVPGQYSLTQNYPNPFNPTTAINFNMPEAGQVSLAVFNLLGEKVADLVNEFRESGNYTVEFNASSLASGTYIYSLNVNGNSITKKMVLMK